VNAIAIAADPRSVVPSHAALAVHQLRLELIEEDLVVDRAIVNGVPAVIDILGRRQCRQEGQRRHERQSPDP
jgi:hypothetical protein